MISDAALANALADTLKYFFPSLGTEIVKISFFLLIFGGIAFLNIRSLKNGVRFIEFTAFGKLIPLLIIVIAGIGFISKSNLHWTIEPTITNVGSASLLLFYAFMGFETPLSNGGELKNVKRTVPLGIFFGITSVLIIYLAIQLVIQGVLGDSIETNKDAPLAAVAGIIFGKSGIILITIATAISMIGALGGEILSVPRILFAGSRDGLMPKILSKVHPRFATPYIAILTYASCGLLFAIFGAFKQLAIIASASALIIYLGAVLATIKQRNNNSLTSEKTFKVPGGIIIPILAASVIIWLLSNLERQELVGVIIFISVFSLIYVVAKFMRNSPKS